MGCHHTGNSKSTMDLHHKKPVGQQGNRAEASPTFGVGLLTELLQQLGVVDGVAACLCTAAFPLLALGHAHHVPLIPLAAPPPATALPAWHNQLVNNRASRPELKSSGGLMRQPRKTTKVGCDPTADLRAPPLSKAQLPGQTLWQLRS